MAKRAVIIMAHHQQDSMLQCFIKGGRNQICGVSRSFLTSNITNLGASKDLLQLFHAAERIKSKIKRKQVTVAH